MASAPDPTAARSVLLVRAFKVLALVEAFTWAGLLVGMFFAYVPRTGRLGIEIFGPLHGAAFIAYGVVTLLVALRLRWRPWPTVLGLLAAIPPFTTIWFERVAEREGLLDVERRHGPRTGSARPVGSRDRA